MSNHLINIGGQTVTPSQLTEVANGFIYQGDFYDVSETPSRTKRRKRIMKKYANKAFDLENYALNLLCQITKVVAGIGCILLAVLFLAEIINYVLPIYPLCVLLSSIILTLLERSKALLIDKLVKAYEKRHYLTVLIVSLFTIAIFAGSMFSTLKGSKKLFYSFGKQTDDIKADYKGLIDIEKAKRDTLLSDLRKLQQAKQALERERFVTKAQQLYGPQISIIENQIDNLDIEIELLREDETSDKGELKEDLEANTHYLFILSLFLEFIIIICNGFNANYERMSNRSYKKTAQFLNGSISPQLQKILDQHSQTVTAAPVTASLNFQSPQTVTVQAHQVRKIGPYSSKTVTKILNRVKNDKELKAGAYKLENLNRYIAIYGDRSKVSRYLSTRQANKIKHTYLKHIKKNLKDFSDSQGNVIIDMSKAVAVLESAGYDLEDIIQKVR